MALTKARNRMIDYVEVNVRDFGAVGDGVTVDTPAFTAALLAIPASGGILYIPAGDYVASINLLARSNIILQGESKEATKIISGSAATPEDVAGELIAVRGDIADPPVTYCENITIRDMTVNTSAVDSNSIGITKARNTVIERVKVTESTKRGISGENYVYYTTIRDCVMSGCGTAAIGFGRIVEDVHIDSCELYSNTEQGIFMSGFNPGEFIDRTTITNCRIHNNTEDGIKINRVRAVISNCYIWENGVGGPTYTYAGIYAHESDGVDILDCHLLDNYDNIILHNGQEVRIIGGECKSATSSNIFIKDNSFNEITGTVIDSAGGYGIYVYQATGTTDQTGISNCIVTNNSSEGIILTAATNTSIIGCKFKNNDTVNSYSLRGTNATATGGIVTSCVFAGDDKLNTFAMAEFKVAFNEFVDTATLVKNGTDIIYPEYIGNTATGSTPGTVIKKVEIFDESGSSLGFIPVYDAIT
jgi:hypothetical protein